MKSIIFLIYAIIPFSLFPSCDDIMIVFNKWATKENKSIELKNGEKVVSRYKDTDFSVFKGYRITTSDRIVLQNNEDEDNTARVYVLELSTYCDCKAVYSFDKKEVIHFFPLGQNSTCMNEVNIIKIKQLIKSFFEFDFASIEVDSAGNTYIWPTENGPKMLRIGPNTLPLDFDRFIYFKDNWYIQYQSH